MSSPTVIPRTDPRARTLLGVCLTLCCGYGSEGLPIGLQFVGHFRDEAAVLRAAALYEASEDWLSRRPNL